MLKGHMAQDAIAVDFEPGTFEYVLEDSATKETLVTTRTLTKSLPDLDVVASLSEDRRRTLVSIVNPKVEQSTEARLNFQGGEGPAPSTATGVVLKGSPLDENEFQQPERIAPSAVRVEGKGTEWSAVCAPFSLTVLQFEHS